MGKVEDEAYKAWLEDVKSEAESITDAEERKAFELVLGNEKLGRRVAKGVVGSKKLYQELNTLNEEKLRLRDTQETWKKWRDEVNETYQSALSERDALKAELKEKEKAARNLGLDDEADELRAARARVDDNTTQKEIEKLKDELKRNLESQTQLANGVPQFVAKALTLSKKYAKDGFEVDDAEVIRTAVQRGAPLDVVYDEFTAAQREKRAKEREEKLVKEAEERGRKEALTQNSSVEGYRPVSGIFADTKRESISEKLAAARAAVRQDVSTIR